MEMMPSTNPVIEVRKLAPFKRTIGVNSSATLLITFACRRTLFLRQFTDLAPGDI